MTAKKTALTGLKKAAAAARAAATRKRTRDKIKDQTTGVSKSGVPYNTYKMSKANPTTTAVVKRAKRQGNVKTVGAGAAGVSGTVGAQQLYSQAERQLMRAKIREAGIEGGLKGADLRALVAQNEGFVSGKTDTVKMNLPKKPKK